MLFFIHKVLDYETYGYINSHAKLELNNSAKRFRSSLSDESLNDCGILKTKEVASQALEKPAPKYLFFSNTEEEKSLLKVSLFLINKAIFL